MVVGTRGELSSSGNLNYEASINYGHTRTFYETGGNVLVANFNRATDARLNSAGQIVCGFMPTPAPPMTIPRASR